MNRFLLLPSIINILSSLILFTSCNDSPENDTFDPETTIVTQAKA